MLQLTVALTSGRSESLTIPESSKVGDLKLMAQKSFGQPFLRLATAEGRVLTDPLELLQNALEDGDQLTAIVGQGQLLATATGFALWCPGGDRVVHWGEPDSGVSYLSVQELHATNFAFAAILGDNSVVTWGARGYGGNSSGMQDQLKNLRRLRAQLVHLLPFWTMAPWLHGAVSLLVQTALKWDISWRMWEKCRPRKVHLLRSWKRAVLLHGAILILVVTALRSKINWGVCSRFVPQLAHLPR